MLLIAQRLKELDACPAGINAFQSMFPDGVEYSTELHQKLLQSEFTIHEEWCVENNFVPALNVTVGDYATAIAGFKGTAIAGNFGKANAGNYGTANAGNYGTANAGNYGTANAGYYGTANAGNYGTATAGHYGTATAGYKGIAAAGYKGIATAGYEGTAAAGIDGIINIVYFENNKKRILTGYIGENGLLPNTKYKVENGVFVKC